MLVRYSCAYSRTLCFRISVAQHNSIWTMSSAWKEISIRTWSWRYETHEELEGQWMGLGLYILKYY